MYLHNIFGTEGFPMQDSQTEIFKALVLKLCLPKSFKRLSMPEKFYNENLC